MGGSGACSVLDLRCDFIYKIETTARAFRTLLQFRTFYFTASDFTVRSVETGLGR